MQSIHKPGHACGLHLSAYIERDIIKTQRLFPIIALLCLEAQTAKAALGIRY